MTGHSRRAISRGTFALKTDVYRLYDGDGRLLYVGVAANGYGRLETHRREKPWWPEVRRVRMERYADRRIALYVEACAIRDEDPVHNVSRNALTAECPVIGQPVEIDDFEVA